MKVRGFTLIEMLAVIVVLSLLATGYYAPQIAVEARRIKRVQADVVAQEIALLGAAAQAYALAHIGGEWPRQEDDCALAHEELTDRLPSDAFSRDTVFHITAGADDALPFAVAENPAHLGRYYFDCSENAGGERPLFRVRLMFDGDAAGWAEYIANQLPNSAVSVSGDYRGVEVGWPEAAVLPALDDYVSKDDPELESNLDMNGHTIFDVGEVILDSGQTLASALQYAGVAVPGNYVNKPACPPGLTPQVVTVPLEMSHPDSQPITHFRVYASDSGGRWRIRSSVHGIGSEFTDSNVVRVGVFTLCS